MSELTPWLITACALALAAFLAIGWHGERAWSRVQSLHLNALWSERERRFQQQPLVALAPAMPEAQAVCEPPPLDGARTLVRSDVITNRQTVGMTLPRWDEGLKRG